ncbi:heme NO-binding domain-containing protein [Brevundimonas sp.]|uniref:heme NO-binding domain-containing protein n=1 Tax=Brevundimonas sp. TaxID=1871086 RepID=UPI002D27C2D8|nr:heme NO-binding domain-containing protein [Brevundimonas sp.]HYC67172.1 heme NO-binding domain-containing protein [Brevundimonas sp.]
MKGVVFTEFLEFVESAMGADTVDAIIAECELSTGGAYTAVGTYPFQEMQDLLMALSKRSQTPPADLLRAFGAYLCTRFVAGYPEFFRRAGSLFKLLASVDHHIHVEVRKLYPDAELPSLEVVENRPERFVMNYRSTRGLEALAEGLIDASARHFKEPVYLKSERTTDEQGDLVRFTITRRAA